ncbi:hypothetical protein F4679DRAFT_599435 [Xylaria curta]|nr:hypothetical protein F4679DRAFT_599435 [Xylaria curta]
MPRPLKQAVVSDLPLTPTMVPSVQADSMARHGMPFRRMHELRDQVRHAADELSNFQAIFIDAQKNPNCPPAALERYQNAVRSKSADLDSLQKKLKPLEKNFEKAQSCQKKRPTQSLLEPKPKRRKRDDQYADSTTSHPPPLIQARDYYAHGETQEVPSKISPAFQPLLLNTATLDVALPPEGCCLTSDECQYHHLERLRRQYARPFELFCEEMDSISDSCLTGVCLALPDMPWSIALSRLAFLFKSMLDTHDASSLPPDSQFLSAGTTIGCEQHVRYIRLAEVMMIQDWRDFMRWAHHQSHVFNLCGRRSCMKLKHMCLEPIDCMASRQKCRDDSRALDDNTHHHDQPTSKATSLIPPTCNSPGCWPPCLFRHDGYSLSHSVAVEFAALHRVSFGPLTSVARKELYTPINEHQLSKLVHNEDVGLIFPFKKSYGRIFVDKWEDNSFIRVDTLLQIPPMYTSEEVRPILEKLPTSTGESFNVILDSLFWYARKRAMPFPVKEIERRTWGTTSFDHRSPRYQCPFCHGFDNFLNPIDSSVEKITDYDDLAQALRHMLLAHNRVPLARKAKFLREEIRHCADIRDAWKTILKEKFDDSIASLEMGVIPRAIADLCGHEKSADSMPTAVSNRSMVDSIEGRVAISMDVRVKKECVENQLIAESKVEG